MAKKAVKKPAKKAAKKAAPSTTKKTNGAVKKAKAPKAKRPKDQRLPGMEIARDPVLDQLCESIADSKESVKDATDAETAARTNALARMRQKNTSFYRAHGIELIRVAGEDKLKVKKMKEDGGEAAEFVGEIDPETVTEAPAKAPEIDDSQVPF